ncbi:unnamed protein product [Urochloa decumbens]|uniref:Uncharacterized protein n=1 Tax=Urochloa decumbens TaxID=240449 RepID=A0ABC9CWF5_9POAL
MALDVGSLSLLPAAAQHAPALDAGASSAARQWSGSGGGGGAAVSVDASALFGGGDDTRLKRELVAWAKAVASMARESAQQQLPR